VERGSTARERVVVTTLGRAGEAAVEAPAVFVVGEVVRVREQLLAACAAAA
jgi:siroheme synthase